MDSKPIDTPSSPPDRTNLRIRFVGFAVVLAAVLAAYLPGDPLGPRGRSGLGLLAFLALSAACSADPKAIRMRTVVGGLLLQAGLAVLILSWSFEWRGEHVRPGYAFFDWLAGILQRLVDFADEGGKFVFGTLADPEVTAKAGLVRPAFLIMVVPTIVFVATLFSVFYHFGVMQFVVQIMGKVMIAALGTRGAETVAAAANIFLGQTEAPLIVKPYLATMSRSELLAVMIGGLATVAGGVMAVYLKMGADGVALLATSVMAAPCSLYLAKMLLPEDTAEPDVDGRTEPSTHANAIDAAAAGASEGMMLAINVIAMVLAFMALLAMVDAVLGALHPGLSMESILAVLFHPVARLIGCDNGDTAATADVLGVKLAANEFIAFVKLTGEHRPHMSERSFTLATYALTGFANFGSIGVLIGGMGALAPTRRHDLARLGMLALLGGYIATLINACLAGLLI